MLLNSILLVQLGVLHYLSLRMEGYSWPSALPAGPVDGGRYGSVKNDISQVSRAFHLSCCASGRFTLSRVWPLSGV